MSANRNELEYYCDTDANRLIGIKNLSLDIKSAINGLSGFVNLLDKCITTPEHKKLLTHIKYSERVLAYLADLLLKETKEEAGLLRQEASCIKLKGLIISILVSVKHQVKDNLKFTYDECIPQELYGNGVKLFEVLNNILEHSLQVVENGLINVSVSLMKNENGTAAVKFVIINDCKMPLEVKTNADFQSQIYDTMLFQTKRGKISLPLAVSNELLKQCGSFLNYESLSKTKEKFSFVIEFSTYSPIIENYK